MNYLYSRIESDAVFSLHTPERRAFARHIQLVVKALHDIEWVDSSDYGPGDENEAIRACLSQTAVMTQLIADAKKVSAALDAELTRAAASLAKENGNA